MADYKEAATESIEGQAEQKETKAESTSGLTETGKMAMRGESQPDTPTDVRGEWVDHGIVDVPVADLPIPEDVNGPEDFNHHISWEDAKAATRELPALRREVAAGKTGDQYSDEDLAAGLNYGQGRRRLYDLYYGSDPVAVDKIGSRYSINSGRHRIFAAKALGLETIPAWVREKKQK